MADVVRRTPSKVMLDTVSARFMFGHNVLAGIWLPDVQTALAPPAMI
ncbi:hypothetical protein [Sphingomonas sp. RT2P30]